MKKGIIGGLLAFVAVILVGCGTQTPVSTSTAGGSGDGSANTEAPIKLGVIAPLSGPAATYGSDVMHGIEVELRKVNSSGGINGKQIELIIEDGKCNGKDATSAIQKLINVDKVVAILGGVCSSETIPAGKIAQAQGVPMLSAGSSSPMISEIGNYIFRYWNDADAGKVMLDYFSDNGMTKVALLYEGTDYAAAYADVVRMGVGSDNIVFDTKFLSEEKDFSILAKSVGENLSSIDALVFIPQSESNVVPFVKALQDQGIWDEVKSKFIGTETVLTDTTIKELGDASEGMQGVRFPTLEGFGGNTVEIAKSLTEGYEVKNADVFVLLAADSLDLITDAIREVGTDGELIQQYIAAVNESNPRDNYVPGHYFNEFGDGQGIPFSIVKVEGGEIVNVE